MFRDREVASARQRYWTTLLTDGLGARGDFALDQLADDAISAAPIGRPFDVYAGVLQPFTSRAVCACLGISEDRRRQLYPWIRDYVRLFDGKLNGKAEFDSALVAVVALYDSIAADYRTHEVPDNYPEHDWIADFVLCLVAGHESTAYLLSTVFRQRDRPCAGKDLRHVVAEALRFDSPIQLLARHTRTDMTLGGRGLRSGDPVYLHLGAANRDPATYSRATEFRVGRAGPAPLAFGLGEGKCLGRSIATRAAIAFLGNLSKRAEWFRTLEVVPDQGLAARGLRALQAVRVQLS